MRFYSPTPDPRRAGTASDPIDAFSQSGTPRRFSAQSQTLAATIWIPVAVHFSLHPLRSGSHTYAYGFVQTQFLANLNHQHLKLSHLVLAADAGG